MKTVNEGEKMERNHIVSNLEIELNTNTASEQDPKSDIYEVMHMDSWIISIIGVRHGYYLWTENMPKKY